MAGEEQDFLSPQAFLLEVEKIHPQILSILTTLQLKVLSDDPNSPLEGKDLNENFIDLCDAYHTARLSRQSARSNLKSKVLQPHTEGKQLDHENYKTVLKACDAVVERFKKIIDKRLAATEKTNGEVGLPRVIRLSRRLKLNEKETSILTYVLVAQASKGDHHVLRGPFGASMAHFNTSVLNLCRNCDMMLSEMLAFLDSERPHMQQGLFPDVQQSYILQCNLGLDEVSLRALIGAPLKSSDMLKLEQTCLSEVILEEEGNEGLRSQFDTLQSVGLGPGGSGLEKDQTEDEAMEKEEKEEEEEEEQVMDLDELLRTERKREKEELKDIPEPPEVTEPETDSDKLSPYKNDLEYLDDHFQLIYQKLKVNSMEKRMEMEAQLDDELRDARSMRQKREAESKAKFLEKKCEKRLQLTKQSGGTVPRLERMATLRGIAPFEKNVLLTLIGYVIQPNKIMPYEGMFSGQSVFTVGELLRLFCPSLQEQIKHRVYFYKMATLVREGMIIVHNSGLNGDPTSAKVEIDRRMLDFCVGLDTEFSEIVEGSHLYYPKTLFDQVVLSKEQKSLILNTVSNFEAYKRCRKKLGMDDAITYGAGMVILFHGAPGTGKTMMANALANKLGKKVLLINFPSLGSMAAGENFKFIFREAKINDAILFFDECEAIFETREKGSHDVNMLLTEIERHDGLIIMATNRPYDLDEAMHRRIMIAIEFRQPDHLLRKAIWESHIPSTMKLADDVDLGELSLRFELTGGFIKNAILSALSIAVSRDGESPVISQKDLLQGANLQLRGRLRMKDFHRRVVPNKGLDKVIVSEQLMKNLKEIVQFEKARSVLFGQWGFGKTEEQGLTVLFHGAPGTGKSLAAEAVGYEVGKPLKVVNCGELLSKWVGESTKNIDAIFEEARSTDAILVFDECEGLFGQRTDMSTSTDRYANVDVGVLLYHIERFPGIIILTTNLMDNMDKAFFRRLKFVLHFDCPSVKLRLQLWKLLIPEETPMEEGIDFNKLAGFDMSGGQIKSAIFRAAARAALRSSKDRLLRMSDLEESAEEEVGKTSTRTSFRRQDSAAESMYN
ncbi:PREDICTED: uncharacterized protein LOC105313451 [Amphimedon queenslandica]|uniref:AAA+ ATPase domain-containing protein n=1 Tax=Amphimedon queenslandica TaxID=400682 RepID=A0A1X7UH62_AMPQE|nr:PREDICTED: uncharacterized protein LOC105313451 [Amphimedon queenslandica]|eukprot:XP_019854420.1 PREDICTED: uncharacterized protein LOC105313451 [Amphimedon queenslandica]